MYFDGSPTVDRHCTSTRAASAQVPLVSLPPLHASEPRAIAAATETRISRLISSSSRRTQSHFQALLQRRHPRRVALARRVLAGRISNAINTCLWDLLLAADVCHFHCVIRLELVVPLRARLAHALILESSNVVAREVRTIRTAVREQERHADDECKTSQHDYSPSSTHEPSGRRW